MPFLGLSGLPRPHFFDRDPQQILAELIAAYEAETGKTLQPAQVERLLIDLMAYRESRVRQDAQDVAEQNLLAYARYPVLDHLGAFLDCTRLAAAPATTTARITFTAALAAPLTVPGGWRCSTGNAVIFAAVADVAAGAGATYVDVPVAAAVSGVVGNGYIAGQVNVAVDGLSVAIASATNLSTSAGGMEAEDNDHYRERIRLAPEKFSNAGSIGAYRYWAMSADSAIVDVAPVSPQPGYVDIYVLMASGLPGAGVLAAVEAICSAEQKRPLCDIVTAKAPTPVDYAITAALTLFSNADQAAALAGAQAAAESHRDQLAAALGRDIVPTQLIAALRVAGVYDVALTAPAALTVLDDSQWARCTGIAISLMGTADG